ncbi:uncharacterized protein O3C94_002760 [Discoglossus pictus]
MSVLPKLLYLFRTLPVSIIQFELKGFQRKLASAVYQRVKSWRRESSALKKIERWSCWCKTKSIGHQEAVSRDGIYTICTRHVWNVWHPSPVPAAHLCPGSLAAVLQWQALCSCCMLKLPVEELLTLAIIQPRLIRCGGEKCSRSDLVRMHL